MKFSLFALTVVAAALGASAYVAETPTTVHKTDKGWSFVYALPKPEEVNYFKVEVAGKVAKWTLTVNDAEVLKGEALAGKYAENLPKEYATQYVTLEVEAGVVYANYEKPGVLLIVR